MDYHHLVFTLPHTLNGWVMCHPEMIYQLLFKAVWSTIRAFGADPKRLGGQIGMTAVLHTWGQNLSQHVHLHCLVPAGVVTSAGQWKQAKGSYLFPVRALSRHFRGTMVSGLRECANQGELHRIRDSAEVGRVLDELMAKDWVVYSKNAIGHTQTLVAYLARYTHRIAISNHRIVAMRDDQVQMSYKDYTQDGKRRIMSLSAHEFIRRLMMHVLPKGLMRIRHYGLLANRCRKLRLAQIRRLLGQRQEETPTTQATQEQPVYPCPKCKRGHLRAIRLLSPVSQPIQVGYG